MPPSSSISAVMRSIKLFRHVIPSHHMSRYPIMSYVTLFHHVSLIVPYIIQSRFFLCHAVTFFHALPSCHSVTSVMSFQTLTHIIRSRRGVTSFYHVIPSHHSCNSVIIPSRHLVASYHHVILSRQSCHSIHCSVMSFS